MTSSYICPVCRAPRKVSLQTQVPASHHLKIAATSLAISVPVFFLYGWELAFKTLLIYLPLWAISELLHTAKMREVLKCSVCGFDPVLYKRDWRSARSQVETRLQSVVDDMKKQLQSTRNASAPAVAPEGNVPSSGLASDTTPKRVATLKNPSPPLRS